MSNDELCVVTSNLELFILFRPKDLVIRFTKVLNKVQCPLRVIGAWNRDVENSRILLGTDLHPGARVKNNGPVPFSITHLTLDFGPASVLQVVSKRHSLVSLLRITPS